VYRWSGSRHLFLPHPRQREGASSCASDTQAVTSSSARATLLPGAIAAKDSVGSSTSGKMAHG
jgi:hypothetical protein